MILKVGYVKMINGSAPVKFVSEGRGREGGG